MPKYHQRSAELSHFNAARCCLILTSHKQLDDFFFVSVFSFSRSSFQIVIFLSLIHFHFMIISIEMPLHGQLAL